MLRMSGEKTKMTEEICANCEGYEEEFECVVCHKKFLRRKKSRVRHRNRVGVRKVGSVTCSKKCASNRLKLRDKKELKKQKEKKLR